MHDTACPQKKQTATASAIPSALQPHGSPGAVPELDNETIGAIRAALQKITRRRVLDADDAEDLVQETLLTMLTRNPGGDLEKGVLAWSQGILRNKVGNYYRKSRRHASIELRRCGVWPQEPQPTAATAQETTVSCKELQALVAETISRFPPEMRRVMELLVSGFEAGEIVDRLHPESYQNVINRLYRGRKKLARELIKCGFGPRVPLGRGRMRALHNRAGECRKAS